MQVSLKHRCIIVGRQNWSNTQSFFVLMTPEEYRRMYRPKHSDRGGKAEDIDPGNL